MPNEPTERLVCWHDRILAAIACTLCVSAQLKFAHIQLLELLYLADMFLVCAWLMLHPPPIRVFKPFFRILVHWTIFGLASLLLSLVAFRQDFYLGPDVSGLTGPGMVTISRLFELALDVYAFVYLACRCREDETLCRFALRFYCAIGFAGCTWGWILAVVFTLRGAAGAYRMTGFNNEGGPFGIYLITVMAATVALRQKRWIGRMSFTLVMPFLTVSLIASKSKAAFLEILVFAIVISVLKMRPLKALIVTSSVALAVFVVFQVSGLSKTTVAYISLGDQYRSISHLRPNDGNYITGRVAGLFLTPKMIAAHPLTGIGLGNYPLVRDDPQYRRGSVIVALPLDSPSLGLIDYVVELGIPLFLYLTWIQIAPAAVLLRHRASLGNVALFLSMPISLWFGAHLNMTYPWITSALALGLFYSDHNSDAEVPPVISRPISASPPIIAASY